MHDVENISFIIKTLENVIEISLKHIDPRGVVDASDFSLIDLLELVKAYSDIIYGPDASVICFPVGSAVLKFNQG
ncbi:unnamed protein product [Protopolystoma xenopodis]|uniref:DUF5745 domain-containing protein n=1 Tax=Protopolystoma xenopodis TaxID=117903 RepID=A0A3S5C5S3_9PLAT|nr:unnamed protein product [Protopolystoma xenopodis]